MLVTRSGKIAGPKAVRIMLGRAWLGKPFLATPLSLPFEKKTRNGRTRWGSTALRQLLGKGTPAPLPEKIEQMRGSAGEDRLPACIDLHIVRIPAGLGSGAVAHGNEMVPLLHRGAVLAGLH